MIEPYEHQVSGAEWLQGRRAILADPLGAGKSRTALMAAQGRTLIVAPNNLRRVWEKQIGLYAPELDYQFLPYHVLARRRQDQTALTVPAKGIGYRWQTIIADEAHNLKGRKTKWTAAFEKLAKKADQVSLLTGTPVPNWGHEIFKLLQILMPGEYPSFWKWVDRWFTMEYNPFTQRMSEIGGLLPYRTWDEFAAQLDGHWLRRENPVELPPIVDEVVEVDMTPKQRKAYVEMESDLLAELDNGQVVVVWHKGAAFTKLWAMSTGLESVSDAKGSGKLDAIEDMELARSGEPTVYFTHFRSSAKAVAARVKGEFVHGGMLPKDRDATIERWERGEFPNLVSTYHVGAEGQTWTRANVVVRVEATNRPSTMDQAKGRIHRIGQTRSCTVVDLVTVGSVDQTVRANLAAKTDQQMELMTALSLLRPS